MPRQAQTESSDNAIPESANLTHEKMTRVRADLVRMSASTAAQVVGTEVEMRSSSAGHITAQTVTAQNSRTNLVQSERMESQAGLVNVTYANTAILNDTQAGIVVARQVHGGPLRTMILLTGQVDGPVETALDTPRALLAGLAAGAGVGLLLILADLVKGAVRKRSLRG